MNSRLGGASAALQQDNLEGALDALVNAYAGLLKGDSPVRQLPIGWGSADALCSEIGSSLPRAKDRSELDHWNDVDLYIATQLYAGGGHTAVIGDFVEHSGSARSALLLTGTVERDIYPDGEPSAEIIARTRIDPADVQVCPHRERLLSLEWLVARVNEIRPRRVFLFHHPEDAVAVSAVRGSAAGRWFLVHHADRQPTSGLHIPGLELIDLSRFTEAFSRLVLQVPGHFFPLTLTDVCAGDRPAFSLQSGGNLLTASSGTAGKFGPQYPEVVASIVQTTGGRHLHIGQLKKAQLEAIAAELSSCGCDPQAFEYVKWVPSLARALWDYGVDLLIGSVPIGGARTKIEACCAATPTLTHHAPGSLRFGSTHTQPDGLPLWQNVSELVSQLKAIDLPWLEHHSQLVRDHFVKNHHPDILRRALIELDQGSAVRPANLVDPSITELCNLRELQSTLCGEWEWAREELPGLSQNWSN